LVVMVVIVATERRVRETAEETLTVKWEIKGLITETTNRGGNKYNQLGRNGDNKGSSNRNNAGGSNRDKIGSNN
jgi:hypothetical protein